eukprot:938249_1
MKCYRKRNAMIILVALCNIVIIICFIAPISTDIHQTLITTVNTNAFIPHVNNTVSIPTLKEILQQTLNTIYNISDKTKQPDSDPRGVSSDHYDPLKTDRFVHTSYNKSNRLKIQIAIPTFINAHENNLRRIQRQSWIKYLEQSNIIW